MTARPPAGDGGSRDSATDGRFNDSAGGMAGPETALERAGGTTMAGQQTALRIPLADLHGAACELEELMADRPDAFTVAQQAYVQAVADVTGWAVGELSPNVFAGGPLRDTLAGDVLRDAAAARQPAVHGGS